MKKLRKKIGILTILVVISLGFVSYSYALLSSDTDGNDKVRVQETYGKLPLYFIQNDRQVDEKVKFYEKGSGHATFFTKEGVYLSLAQSPNSEVRNPKSEATLSSKPATRNSQLIKLTPLNANKDPEIVAEGLQDGKVNYFIGNNPEKWKTNVPTYKAVVYKEIYKDIDMKFYGNNRQLEYDIVLKPGTDPSVVRLAYKNKKQDNDE